MGGKRKRLTRDRDCDVFDALAGGWEDDEGGYPRSLRWEHLLHASGEESKGQTSVRHTLVGVWVLVGVVMIFFST